MVLPTNVDSTYADSGTDASVAAHQQHHDTVHTAVNALAGGTTGQVLAKTSSADYAQGWLTPGYGGGDIFRSGYYSLPNYPSGAFTSTSSSVGFCYFVPMVVPITRTFDRIGVNATGAGTGGAVRLGIYTGAGVPTALLLDAGQATVTTTGAKEIVINQTLTPGLYWLAVVAQGSLATSYTTFASGNYSVINPQGTAPPTTANVGFYYASGVTGALPSTPTIAGYSYGPVVSLRAA